MRDESMSTVTICGKEVKKETVVLASFYGIAFIASVLIPNMIAVAIAASMTKSFCDTNPNICSQYDHGAKGLIEGVEGAGYGSGVAFSIFAGCMVAMIMIKTKRCLDHCKEKQNDDIPLAPASQSEDCCRLFKTCIDNVLPTKFDVAQLVITSIGLIGSVAYSGALMSLLTMSSFGVGAMYDKLSPSELKTLDDFSGSVFNKMMISAVALGAIVSLVISVASMVIAVCIKYRMNSEEDGRLINQDGDNDYGSGGQHRFEL